MTGAPTAEENRGASADDPHPGYDHEHLFIDNASKGETVEILRELAAVDERVTVIVTTRNGGHVRLPARALLHSACGDVPPAELETAYHRQRQEAIEAA